MPVSIANQHSTRLSQDAQVGVKCRWKRGRMAQPALDGRGLVCGELSMTRWTSQSARDMLVDRVEELAELDGSDAGDGTGRSPSRLSSRARRTGRSCRGGDSHGCAVRPGRDASATRVRCDPGLDLRLLVDAQDQRAIRRGQVKPDDVAQLLDEQRVMESLKASVRCGCRAKARQMRPPRSGSGPRPGRSRGYSSAWRRSASFV